MSANIYILEQHEKAISFSFATWEICKNQWLKDVDNKTLAKDTYIARNNLLQNLKKQRQFIQKELDKSIEKVRNLRENNE